LTAAEQSLTATVCWTFSSLQLSYRTFFAYRTSLNQLAQTSDTPAAVNPSMATALQLLDVFRQPAVISDAEAICTALARRVDECSIEFQDVLLGAEDLQQLVSDLQTTQLRLNSVEGLFLNSLCLWKMFEFKSTFSSILRFDSSAVNRFGIWHVRRRNQSFGVCAAGLPRRTQRRRSTQTARVIADILLAVFDSYLYDYSYNYPFWLTRSTRQPDCKCLDTAALLHIRSAGETAANQR
jgi:hypothetical protein